MTPFHRLVANDKSYQRYRMAMSPGKNSQIEILRAVAIIFTIIHHMPMALGYFPQFYFWLYSYGSFHIGVDLFFVISGFVITQSLCKTVSRDKATRWKLMLAFWLKRVFRLLPLAWTWLLLSAIYVFVSFHLLGQSEKPGNAYGPIIAGFLQIANWYSAYCGLRVATNPALCNFDSVAGHYWSLSLEEQFYIVYPLLFFFLNRKLLIGLLCIALIGQVFWDRPVGSMGWYFRTDALAYGVLLGLFSTTSTFSRLRAKLERFRYANSAVMLALIMLLPVVSRNVEGFAGTGKFYGVAFVALICALIVALASFDFPAFRPRSLLYRTLLYLGSRSYALYVCHFLLFYAIGKTVGAMLHSTELGPVAETITYTILVSFALALVVMASEVSYRLIESPYRPRGIELAKRVLAR